MLHSLKTKQTNNTKNISTDVNVTFTSNKLRKTFTVKQDVKDIIKSDVKTIQKHYYSRSHNYYPDGNAGNYQGL